MRVASALTVKHDSPGQSICPGRSIIHTQCIGAGTTNNCRRSRGGCHIDSVGSATRVHYSIPSVCTGDKKRIGSRAKVDVHSTDGPVRHSSTDTRTANSCAGQPSVRTAIFFARVVQSQNISASISIHHNRASDGLQSDFGILSLFCFLWLLAAYIKRIDISTTVHGQIRAWQGTVDVNRVCAAERVDGDRVEPKARTHIVEVHVKTAPSHPNYINISLSRIGLSWRAGRNRDNPFHNRGTDIERIVARRAVYDNRISNFVCTKSDINGVQNRTAHAILKVDSKRIALFAADFILNA